MFVLLILIKILFYYANCIIKRHLKDLATEAGVDDVAASAAAAKDRRLGAMAGRALHVADQGFTRGLAVLTSDPATRDQARADLKRLMDREGGGVYYSLFKVCASERFLRAPTMPNPSRFAGFPTARMYFGAAWLLRTLLSAKFNRRTRQA